MNSASQPGHIVILGGGSGGYACALRAAELGYQVTLIEKDQVGGTCLHRGCIPTKAWLHAAEVADTARTAAEFGIQASFTGVDAAQVRAYSDQVVARLFKGLSGLITGRKIKLITGAGKVERTAAGRLAVRVGTELIEGDHLVLASGSQPRSIPGVEVNGKTILLSDQALRLDSLPASAIVLGGGVIGVEFASAWTSLGVAVTIVEAAASLVPNEDPALSTGLQRAFRKRKINFLVGNPVSAVATTPDGVKVTVGDQELSAEVLLVAVGRGPVSDNLGYVEAGVNLAAGYVVTDERLRTSTPGIRAVGDLAAPNGKPGLQLAHRGFAHGIFVAEDIAFADQNPAVPSAPVLATDTQIPRVTYCEPELASVGLTEAQAQDEYGAGVETVTYDLAGNGKSQILRTSGFVKLVRAPDGPVVGVHLIGARVGELITEAQLITNWEAYPDDVAGLIHPHPTQSEALGEAHLVLAGKPLHAHG